MGLCTNLAPGDTLLSQRLPTLWPHIWAWTQYLISRCVVQSGPYSLSPKKVFRLVTGIVDGFVQKRELREALVDTPGFIRSIASYWLELDEELCGLDEKHTFPDILRKLWDSDNYPVKASLCPAEILEGAGGCYQTFARAALKQLLLHMGRKPVYIAELWADLAFMERLQVWYDTGAPNPQANPLRRALYDVGGVPTFVKCLLLVDAQSITLQRCQSTVAIFDFLRYCFGRRLNSRYFMTQAINSGVIKAFLGASDAVPTIATIPKYAGFTFSGTLVFGMIGSHMVYRSVIRAICKQLERDPYVGIITEPIARDWRQFLDAFEQRRAIMKDFEREYCWTCRNCGRTKWDARGISLRQCAKCQGPRYCSTSCQKKDWSKHKSHCLRPHEGCQTSETCATCRYGPTPRHEQDFIGYLAGREVENRVTEFNRILGTQYPTESLQSLLFAVDLNFWLGRPHELAVHKMPQHVQEWFEQAMDPREPGEGREKQVIWLKIDYLGENGTATQGFDGVIAPEMLRKPASLENRDKHNSLEILDGMESL